MNYAEIIHEDCPSGGAPSLKSRLVRFRKWATRQAGISVHSALCVVNGEATDGTRNAPVLVFETRPDPRTGGTPGGANGVNSSSGSGVAAPSEARCGAIDNPADRAMYDRSIGCQVRTVRELKKDEVAFSVPVSAMVSPDLIAASDAGRAIYACCQRPSKNLDGNFWDAFVATASMEKLQSAKIQQSNGTQLLVKILQERKKVETAVVRAERVATIMQESSGEGDDEPPAKSTAPGTISRRAPYLAFLIQQRFANERDPPVWAWDQDNEKDIGAQSPLPEGAPGTFAPYARILPSSSSLPICWKRNELALLAGCIPGMPPLQKVAARTMQLAAELIALVEAGLLWRFPDVFVPGMITWDRWVWAAAMYETRAMPASTLPPWLRPDDAPSPVEVWEGCGVMVPFLDMLNHEDDAAQVFWGKPGSEVDEEDAEDEEDEDEDGIRRLDVMTAEKTKKHMQVYRNYGVLDNEHFMMQFGFTRMSNPADRVRLSWALVDGVGGVPPPPNYELVWPDDGGVHPSRLVFDSTDPESLKAWWTEWRIALLGRSLSDDSLDLLRKGKKLTFSAFNNGNIDPMLTAVAVVATVPPDKVADLYKTAGVDSSASKPLEGLILDKTCQNSVRLYLSFLFSKKLAKLLQSLNSCLKDHFNSVELWTKATSGGLNYVASNSANDLSIDGEKLSAVIGWQTFFDTYAWYSTMEVESRYYSMAPDSCVLTFYDGHVKSLQSSLDAMATDEVFCEKVGRHLEDLGCTLDDTVAVMTMALDTQPVVTPTAAAPVKEIANQAKFNSVEGEEQQYQNSIEKKNEPGNELGCKENDKHQNQAHKEAKVNNSLKTISDCTNPSRAPAIKLHIGNLSYKTRPDRLYDFFTRLYGEGSVLECHIPRERDTGNSRGFGFVTMPEERARTALESGRRHEMDGRMLKVAESNSAGGARGLRDRRSSGVSASNHNGVGSGSNAPLPSSDRCPSCGYRPRWCTCSNPNMMSTIGAVGGSLPQDPIYGPGPYGVPPPPPPPMGAPGYAFSHLHDLDDRRVGDGYGWSGGGGGSGWGSGRRSSYSRSPSPHRRRGDRDRDRDRGGRYRRDRSGGRCLSRSYSRSRSRSYSRDRGRDRDREHHGRHHHHRSRREDDRRRDDDRDRRRYEENDRRRGLDRERRGSSRRHRSRSRSRSRGRGCDGGASPPGRDDSGLDLIGSLGGGGRVSERRSIEHSTSRSRSPMDGDDGMMGDHRRDPKKREGRGGGRSRSRDRGSSSRSSRRKRSSKGSRRGKESSSSKRRGSSRSRSRDRHRD